MLFEVCAHMIGCMYTQVVALDLLEVLLNTFGRHVLPAAARLSARLVDLLRTTAFDPGMLTRASTVLHRDVI